MPVMSNYWVLQGNLDLWDEPERRGEPFPDAYAVHHWAESWRGRAQPG